MAGGREFVEASGDRVRDLIDDVERQYPGIKERLCDSNQMRAGITVAVDGSVAALGLLQPVQPDSEVHFLPSIGGG